MTTDRVIRALRAVGYRVRSRKRRYEKWWMTISEPQGGDLRMAFCGTGPTRASIVRRFLAANPERAVGVRL